MKFFGYLMRAYSYIFHLVLSLLTIAAALLTTSGEQLRLTELLPFNANNIVRGLIILGAAGLLSTFLAISGVFRYLFPIWVTIVLFLVIRGVFFSSYVFASLSRLRTLCGSHSLRSAPSSEASGC